MSPVAGSDSVDSHLRECIDLYNNFHSKVERIAAAPENRDRSFAGIVRAEKGRLIEEITRNLVCAAWQKGGREMSRLCFDRPAKVDIPINPAYLSKRSADDRRKIRGYKTRHGVDLHVRVDGDFVLAVECKTYSENAMLKRILFDANLLRSRFPNLRFALVQLHSLGGTTGGPQTRVLMSYMPEVDLKIVTLLDGDRKVERVKRPLSKLKPPLKRDNLLRAVDTIAGLLDRENAVD